MTIKYDKIADAVYVVMSTEGIKKTLKMNDRLMVDLDAAGNTVGIEILDASSQQGLIDSLERGVDGGIPVSIVENAPVLA